MQTICNYTNIKNQNKNTHTQKSINYHPISLFSNIEKSLWNNSWKKTYFRSKEDAITKLSNTIQNILDKLLKYIGIFVDHQKY